MPRTLQAGPSLSLDLELCSKPGHPHSVTQHTARSGDPPARTDLGAGGSTSIPSWTVSTVSHAEQCWGSEALSPSRSNFCNRQDPTCSCGFNASLPARLAQPGLGSPTQTRPHSPPPLPRPPFSSRQGHPPCTRGGPGRRARGQPGIDPWNTVAKASGGLAWACVGTGI